MDHQSVFRHARALQEGTTLTELMGVVERAVRELTRFQHSWVGLCEEPPVAFRILAVSAELQEVVFEKAPRIPVEGDGMLREVMEHRSVVVVEDARSDPRTNKYFVDLLDNRTIVHVPLAIGNRLLGALAVGSFGDEGVVVPTADELDALVVFGVQLAAAIDRVRALAERQALQLQLETLQRVELMGVLAAGVAHDLNNYLSIVLSTLELLSVDLPERRGDLAPAKEATQRAASVAGHLLSLGRPATPPTLVDLDARVAATVQLVRPTIPKGVRVEHVASGQARLRGDPVQVDQAVANLLLNARDALGRKGTITLTTDRVEFDRDAAARAAWAREGRFARLRVHDDGPGIPPELQQRVFDPLFTTKPQGTGLGLAVVLRVVQQHQGLVRCESLPGQGTTFEVYFPEA